MNISDWNYYYNLEGQENVRANLVYTPYVSPDNTTFCMSFNRDRGYHKNENENVQWTEELLTERFLKEIKFHSQASETIPTLRIKDINHSNRKIFLEWHGDDFFMQGLKADGYNKVLPNWQEQWLDLIKKMRAADIFKISLHPNSWIAHQDTLIPFNWFFCYQENDEAVTLQSLLIQISSGRQEKLGSLDLLELRTPRQLQQIAFNSFRHNYPTELIDNVLQTA
jgi:predicted component of viral defense system (DUF524 family)